MKLFSKNFIVGLIVLAAAFYLAKYLWTNYLGGMVSKVKDTATGGTTNTTDTPPVTEGQAASSMASRMQHCPLGTGYSIR